MGITIGSIFPPTAPTGGVLTVDNGLTLSTPTNAELGGQLITDTIIDPNGNDFEILDLTGEVIKFLLSVGSGITASIDVDGTGQDFSELSISDESTISFVAAVAGQPISFNIFSGRLIVIDGINMLGIQNNADYSANIITQQNALTTTRAVQLLINAVFDPALYALISGQVFTGNISAPNLSGTNTGDQNLTPYALLSGATFTGPISSTQSNSNNYIPGLDFIVSSASPVSLVVGSAFNQVVTGTVAQTILLPVVSTLQIGQPYRVVNITNQNTVVQSSGGNVILTLPPGLSAIFYCRSLTGTNQASWLQSIDGNTQFASGSESGGFVLGTGATLTGTTLAATTTISGTANFSAAIKLNLPATVVSGSTSGTATFSQDFTGLTYKKVVVFCSALLGTASFTFPTAFANIPGIVTTSAGPASATITSLTINAVTITGTTSNGFIFLEGF